ncbi:MAG: SDR family oxidoreductase [Rhodospirillales bacterium]|nr:SDR family oxidoreductase [Rhodospirillales bacterium]
MTETRKALVTGGTKGIGRAIAERLRDDGATVTITGTKPDGDAPEGCAYLAVDFSDRAATLALAEKVAGMGFDILVNNAGTNKVGPIEDYAVEDFERIMQVNVTAPFIMCKAVIPGMKKKGWGRIVNISSLWGIGAREHRQAYTASKFAIDGMTASIAAEVAEDGILANCVAPGFIRTELSITNLGEAGLAEMAKRVPVRRCGSVEEVAGTVAFLASDQNTYIAGQNIPVDGGFTRSRG